MLEKRRRREREEEEKKRRRREEEEKKRRRREIREIRIHEKVHLCKIDSTKYFMVVQNNH